MKTVVSTLSLLIFIFMSATLAQGAPDYEVYVLMSASWASGQHPRFSSLDNDDVKEKSQEESPITSAYIKGTGVEMVFSPGPREETVFQYMLKGSFDFIDQRTLLAKIGADVDKIESVVIDSTCFEITGGINAFPNATFVIQKKEYDAIPTTYSDANDNERIKQLNESGRYTARAFAEEIGATVVIKFDEARQRFYGFTLDAPDDGFVIEGGKGYIVNVPEGRVVTFTEAAWTNKPPVEAAPTLAQKDGAWAFVVSGRFAGEAEDSYRITVKNTRTNAIATDVVRARYFAAAFADLNRKNVVQIGDSLEVTVTDGKGEIVSNPLPYLVTAETIRQAFLPITLKRVEIPRQSLLLQNYPNPFNPETWIPYQLGESADVVVRICDVQGRLVRTLDLGHRKAGFYLGSSRAAYWDGKNETGEKVASGVYFYQIQAGAFSASRKMLIVK